MPDSDGKRSLRRGSLALLAIGVGGFAADYGLNLGLSKLLSTHEYGDFRVAHSFAAICGVAVLLGGDRAAPKVLAGPLARDQPAILSEYLRFYSRLALLLSAAVIAFTWLASWLHLGHTDPEDHHAVAWAVVGVPVGAFGALISRALQSANHQTAAALPWRVIHPVATLGLIAAAAVVLGGIGVEHAVVIGVLVTGLVGAWQWWLLSRRVVPVRPRDPDLRQPRAWLGTSLPMMGAFLVALGLSQSDLYFLEILGDESSVGHYAAAMTTAHFLLLVQTAVVGMVAPALASALEADRAAAGALMRRGTRMMLVGVVPTTLLLGLAAGPILRLFGEDFTDAASALALLAVGNACWALAALSVLRLQYTGRAAWVVAVTAAVLLADSVLNAILIPRFGMLGAAGSTAATLCLAALGVVISARGAARAEA